MKKSGIESHSDRGPSHPAVNVKAGNLGIYASGVAAHFDCSEDAAEKALQYAIEVAQERFWEDAREEVKEIFGPHAKMYSEGRSGGWLVVHGLSDIETWDAIAVARWSRLVSWCEAEVKHLSSKESLLDDIAANEWHKDGAERYNFIEKDGTYACIADLKAQAKAAGFGAVVRP